MKSDVLTAETGGMVQEIIMPRLLGRGGLGEHVIDDILRAL